MAPPSPGRHFRVLAACGTALPLVGLSLLGSFISGLALAVSAAVAVLIGSGSYAFLDKRTRGRPSENLAGLVGCGSGVVAAFLGVVATVVVLVIVDYVGASWELRDGEVYGILAAAAAYAGILGMLFGFGLGRPHWPSKDDTS